MSKSVFFKYGLPLLALALFPPLAACKTGYVNNFFDLPVPAGSGAQTKDKIKGVILVACLGRGWVAQEIQPGLIRATMTVPCMHHCTAATHSAQIEIPFTGARYSIIYKNSANLNYDPQKQIIHKQYNKWVNNLRQDIDVGLARL